MGLTIDCKLLELIHGINLELINLVYYGLPHTTPHPIKAPHHTPSKLSTIRHRGVLITIQKGVGVDGTSRVGGIPIPHKSQK